MPKSLQFFIKNTKSLMQKAPISQNKLGEAIGLHSGNLSTYLSGKHEPGLDIIEKISDHFGVTVAELLTDPNKSPIKPRVIEPSAADALAVLNRMFDKYGDIIALLETAEPGAETAVREVLEALQPECPAPAKKRNQGA